MNHFKLAAQENLIPGGSLEEKWDILAEAGFDGIELRGKGGDFAARLPELRRAASNGVRMSSVCLISDHFIGDFDPDKRASAITTMKELLTTIAVVGGRGALTPASFGMFSRALPPFNSPRKSEEDHEVLLDGLSQLAAHAQSEGVTLWLEPLNRFEDHMVNRLEKGAEYCAEVGSPHMKLMADFFHMNIEEYDIPSALRNVAPFLDHVHLADSQRAHPGTGHIAFGSAMSALEEIGFDGYLAMECEIWGDVPTALHQVASIVRGE